MIINNIFITFASNIDRGCSLEPPHPKLEKNVWPCKPHFFLNKLRLSWLFITWTRYVMLNMCKKITKHIKMFRIAYSSSLFLLFFSLSNIFLLINLMDASAKSVHFFKWRLLRHRETISHSQPKIRYMTISWHFDYSEWVVLTDEMKTELSIMVQQVGWQATLMAAKTNSQWLMSCILVGDFSKRIIEKAYWL